MVKGSLANGQVSSGSFAKIAAHFGVRAQTVGKTWRQIKLKVSKYVAEHREEENDDRNLPLFIFQTGRSRCGRKPLHDREAVKKAALSLPTSTRRTYRNLAGGLGMPLSTIYRLQKQDDVFYVHSVSLKPRLKESNKIQRLFYALDMIAKSHEHATRTLKFYDFYNTIHVDEKWFYLVKEGQRIILVQDEKPPQMSVHNKNSIAKVMFLCALARPKTIDGTYFDGKIGIWPIGLYKPAARSSKYRPRGTMEWHNVNVDKNEYRRLMLGSVLEAVIEKWPSSEFFDDDFVINIQQDGASTHIDPKDSLWLEALEEMGLENKIKLVKQPPNSPDTNVNDLGFFNSLQSRYYTESPTSSEQIIAMVNKAFVEYPPNLINRIWLTYMSCLNMIIENDGGNHYKIPHMNKAKMEHTNTLPVSLDVTDKAKPHLMTMDEV